MPRDEERGEIALSLAMANLKRYCFVPRDEGRICHCTARLNDLFVPQRFHRLQVGGSAGWVKPKENPNRRRKQGSQQN